MNATTITLLLSLSIYCWADVIRFRIPFWSACISCPVYVLPWSFDHSWPSGLWGCDGAERRVGGVVGCGVGYEHGVEEMTLMHQELCKNFSPIAKTLRYYQTSFQLQMQSTTLWGLLWEKLPPCQPDPMQVSMSAHFTVIVSSAKKRWEIFWGGYTFVTEKQIILVL